jgi:glycerol dehydrogenase
MIFAVGGGKAIDLGKLAADLLGKPLFAFPTAASSCSAFTPFAEIYPSGGRYSERLALKNAPIHVFLDTVLLAEAPAKYLRSAMGQTCAAYFDTEISTRYKNLRHLNALGLDALKRCAETVFEKGDRAFFDNIKHITSREFEDVVYAVTASAGFSQTMLAHDGLENGFDGLSRAVCNALVSVGADLKRTRGEIMSFGALIALLYDGQIGEYTRMIRFCEKTDMPFILRDFGLGAEAVYPLADRICRDPVLLNYPCKIDPVKLKTALSRQI